MHPRLALRLLTIEAARALARNKLRAALAILGVTVAVATVIWVIAIGRAGREQAEAFSVAIGVFFGFYPAHRAAKLDPIVALRTE